MGAGWSGARSWDKQSTMLRATPPGVCVTWEATGMATGLGGSWKHEWAGQSTA